MRFIFAIFILVSLVVPAFARDCRHRFNEPTVTLTPIAPPSPHVRPDIEAATVIGWSAVGLISGFAAAAIAKAKGKK